MPAKLQLDKDYIIKRANEGANANQIAKELNCCHPTMIKFFRENNLSINRIKKFDGELPEEEIIYKYTILKQSPEQIKKKYGCSCNPIYNILDKKNIKRNEQKEYIGKLGNENFFENIDTEEKAYILGLIMANGSLYNGKFRLCLIDKEMIEKVASLLGWKGKIYYSPSKLNKFPNNKYCITKENWSISICNKKLVNDCAKYGVMPNKSFELSLPNIQEDLLRYVIIGFFDGNASIIVNKHKNKIKNGWINGYPRYKVIGLKKILTEINNFLIKNCNINSKIKLQKSGKKTKIELFNLEYRGYIALRIRDYLYKDAKIYLKRKYDKFFSIIAPQFSGYLVSEYAKKYNFSKRSIQRWISEGKLPHIIENQLRVIPFKEGDDFAIKKININIQELLDLYYSGKYKRTELAKIFGITQRKVSQILKQNIRNFGFSGESPMEINYNLDI